MWEKDKIVFCTSKYYPHICSAKQLRMLFVPRASVNAHEIRGLFYAHTYRFPDVRKMVYIK